MRASEMRTMSLTPARASFGGDRQIAGLGHGVAALRPGVLQHQKIVGGNVEVGRVDARGEIVEGGEHHGAAFAFEQPRIGGGALDNGAVRRQRAEQSRKPALLLIRLAERADDVAIDPRRGLRQPLAERLAGHRHAVEVQQRFEFAQHRADAAGRQTGPTCSAGRSASGRPGSAFRRRACSDARATPPRRHGRRWR